MMHFMENSTRLLERHRTILDSPDTLLVEATDPALADLFPRALRHSDLHGADEHVQTAPLPALAPHTRRVVILLPKTRERLEMLLAVLAGQCREPQEAWLVGPARGGIRGGLARLKAMAGTVESLDSARHCKLYRAWLPPGPARELTDFARHWRAGSLDVISYPGVFSHGRLDEGTAALLAVLEAETHEGEVLDMGCGAGVLSAALARAGARVTGVDASSTAVAAARATLAANGLRADLHCGDLYNGLGQFRAIWSNPPFHQGMRRTLAVTGDLIRRAPRHLQAGGSLTLVANRELPYPDLLDGVFRNWRILHENNRFRVYRGWRS